MLEILRDLSLSCIYIFLAVVALVLVYIIISVVLQNIADKLILNRLNNLEIIDKQEENKKDE